MILNGAAIWLLACLLLILPLFIGAAVQEHRDRKARANAPQAQVIQFPSTKKDKP